MVLFRKVEAERQSLSGAVQREVEKLTGKIVFLFFIFGAALIAPLSVDIYLSVQYVCVAALSAGQVAVVFLAGFVGMIVSLVLFVIYDRHYYARNLRKNIVHAVLFAIGVSVLSLLSTYAVYSIQTETLSGMSNPSASGANMILIVGILRTAIFVGITPVMTYLTVNKLKLRK